MTAAMHLYVGRHATGISIEPEGRYASMWRVRWPDGWLSRARPRGLGRGEVAHWRRRGTAPERPQAAVLDAPASLVAEEAA